MIKETKERRELNERKDCRVLFNEKGFMNQGMFFVHKNFFNFYNTNSKENT